ncbi:MAG: hypothetical protein Q9166_007488 [cf. Caloplaca sp. 2 TL-2023]
MKSESRPARYHGNVETPVSLMDLPRETLDAIIEDVSIHDKASLAVTNKTVKAYIEPHLYEKMYTRIGTPQDTAGLVALLTSRPDITSFIKMLVLDEYHPNYTRKLLSIKMPNLWCMLIQHEGQPVEHISEREKRALNRNLVDQPKLRNFVFWMEPRDQEPLSSTPDVYQLSKEDAALLKQPAVERFRLSNIDFSAFDEVDQTYFTHKGLKTVWIENSWYSSGALTRLLAASEKLTDLTIHHAGDPPFIPDQYLPVLSPSAKTLKVLRLEWRHTRSCHSPGYDGLDLTAFTALRLLHIQPGVLLGPGGENGGEGVASYATPKHPDLLNLIRSRLPSGLKMLLLESLTVPSPIGDLKMLLFPMDQELIRCLITQKKKIAPRLRYIFMYYLEEMVEPKELCELADEHGMEICGLFRGDIIDPGWEHLDADSFVARNGQVKQW